jgi:hypothetical protein
MDIKNIIILKNLQYFILSAVIIFAALSLFIKGSKRKFIFLALFIASSLIFDFTLYYGDLFFLFFVPFTLFIIILYLQNLQMENYLPGAKSSDEVPGIDDLKISQDRHYHGKAVFKKVYVIFMPVLFCGGFIFLFFKFGSNYTAKFNIAKTITLINFSVIAREAYANYGMLVFLLIVLVFILLLWLISIILIRKKK